MGLYATIEVPLNCPQCRHLLGETFLFGWGGVASSNPFWSPAYSVGDRIMWYCDDDGVVRGLTHNDPIRGANLGDPRFQRVVVRSEYNFPTQCGECDSVNGGAAFTVVRNRIEGAIVVDPGFWAEDDWVRVYDESDRLIREISDSAPLDGS